MPSHRSVLQEEHHVSCLLLIGISGSGTTRYLFPPGFQTRRGIRGLVVDTENNLVDTDREFFFMLRLLASSTPQQKQT